MQSLCEQVINGRQRCSYGWRTEAGGASLEEEFLSSGEIFMCVEEEEITPAST